MAYLEYIVATLVICAAITVIIVVLIHKKCINKYYQNSFVQTITIINVTGNHLSKFDYGKQVWNQHIHDIKSVDRVKLIVKFPDNVTSATSSFIQGFLNEYVSKYGWKSAKFYITIEGSDILVKKFNDEIRQR